MSRLQIFKSEIDSSDKIEQKKINQKRISKVSYLIN